MCSMGLELTSNCVQYRVYGLRVQNLRETKSVLPFARICVISACQYAYA